MIISMSIILSYVAKLLYYYPYDEHYDEFLYEANTKNNKIKLSYNERTIEKINKVLRKKIKKIHKLRNISVNTEKILERFCTKKKQLIQENIYDYNFEKKLPEVLNDPYIFVVEHSFSLNECEEMINQFERETHLHYNGVTGGGYNPTAKRTTEINISSNSSWQKWNNICFNRLKVALNEYAKHCINECHNSFLIGPGEFNDTGYQLQKYLKEQQYYKWHQDGGLKKSSHQHRIITYLWYLNDVFEGGETLFFNGKVKPTAGKLVLFPACWCYNHKGETPISNDKYIITGWVYSNN